MKHHKADILSRSSRYYNVVNLIVTEGLKLRLTHAMTEGNAQAQMIEECGSECEVCGRGVPLPGFQATQWHEKQPANSCYSNSAFLAHVGYAQRLIKTKNAAVRRSGPGTGMGLAIMVISWKILEFVEKFCCLGDMLNVDVTLIRHLLQ